MISSKLTQKRNQLLLEIQGLSPKDKVLDLANDHPLFPVPSGLVELVAGYMSEGFNHCLMPFGEIVLREQIAHMIETLYGYGYDPQNEITICGGATQAIYTSITALVREGDEVLVFEPANQCYAPSIEINGGRPVYVQLKEPDFHINWSEVRKMVTGKTRMIILNSPHNPTGAVLGPNDMKELQRIVRGTNIIILSDEVYQHMVYNQLEHESVARYPALAKRSMIAYSFGETYNITGWGLGYCVGPAKLMREFRKIQQIQLSSFNVPIQLALAEFMAQRQEYLHLSEFYQGKRDYFQHLLNETRLTPLPVWGGCSQLVDYSQISQDPDWTFASKLLHNHQIAAIPLSAFHHEGKMNKYVRLCFARHESALDSAAKIFSKL